MVHSFPMVQCNFSILMNYIVRCCPLNVSLKVVPQLAQMLKTIGALIVSIAEHHRFVYVWRKKMSLNLIENE